MLIRERNVTHTQNEKKVLEDEKKIGTNRTRKLGLACYLLVGIPLDVVAEQLVTSENVTSEATVQVTRKTTAVIEQGQGSFLPQTNSVASVELLLIGLLILGIVLACGYKSYRTDGSINRDTTPNRS